MGGELGENGRGQATALFPLPPLLQHDRIAECPSGAFFSAGQTGEGEEKTGESRVVKKDREKSSRAAVPALQLLSSVSKEPQKVQGAEKAVNFE